VPQEIFFWTLWCKGRTEAETSTIRLHATLSGPSGLINDPPPSSLIFTPDALPVATVPIYPGLGQAPNILDCISSGFVIAEIYKYYKTGNKLLYTVYPQST